jgi:hypothetical protein
MHRFRLVLVRCCLTLIGILLIGSPARAQLLIFHDRATFTAALAGLPSPTSDDYESYAQGVIAPADRRGDFLYSSDPSLTQPAIVPGGNGGQALGGSPFDVFVGGDSVLLSFQPLKIGSPPFLQAMGADFLYAPSFDDIPADTYRLGVEDGTASGQFAGNLDGLDAAGGTFFLGIIAAPSAVFTQVDLFSVQQDPSFLVPAYQVDNLTYVAVPEPTALSLFTLGSILLLARLRRPR